jgi:DtxR family transcriptional regulator, Mn-dependent transcriptional regulator
LGEDDQERVTTNVLAERLGISPASVTGMLKKLAGRQLVTYEPYQGVTLTAGGRKIALQVIRHHRLVERYLAEALGVPWDQVHAEADKWEHVLSEDLETRMDSVLGFPTTDPHGAPIPRRDGTMVKPDCIPLADLKGGQSAVICEVRDRDPDLLRYVGELELYPGVPLAVIARAPFQGPLTIRVGQVEHVLGRQVAGQIFVTDVC